MSLLMHLSLVMWPFSINNWLESGFIKTNSTEVRLTNRLSHVQNLNAVKKKATSGEMFLFIHFQ